LFGLTSSWPVYLACYVIFIGIHLYGVGEALRLTLGITAIAVVALVVFVIAMIPKFDADKLFDIVPNSAAGASDFIPFGYAGVLAALVYGIWFFLAVEGVPLAAEEARDPRKDMPRGIITAMGILLVFAALMLVFTAGGAGSSVVAESDNPLPLALRTAFGGDTWVADFVNYVGLAGLVASFFSIVYAYSRQLFALSRAGYLPRFLSVTGKRKTPYLALTVPGLIGFLLAAITQDGALLINIAVFGATVSYVLMMLAHIVLRVREPGLERPYRTPGGVGTTGVALVLAITAVVATFFVDKLAAAITAGIFVVAIAYFWFYSRHHLVASAPEEEFAAIQQAESELS
jgi:ethanolamine permease